jgi:hypothetical protein
MDQVFDTDAIAELGAEFAAAGNTRIPAVTCTYENELSEDDIREYVEKSGDLPAVKSDQKDLAMLRARHHQVARFLAAGLPEGVIATLTDYDAAYISTLKQSPSMLELIAHYRAPGDNAVRIMTEKLRLMADMSVEQIFAKLEAGDLDANQLLAAIKLGADRSNNGPMSKLDISHTHQLDEEQVQRLADTARKRNAGRIIDISAVRQALPSARPEGEDES